MTNILRWVEDTAVQSPCAWAVCSAMSSSDGITVVTVAMHGRHLTCVCCRSKSEEKLETFRMHHRLVSWHGKFTMKKWDIHHIRDSINGKFTMCVFCPLVNKHGTWKSEKMGPGANHLGIGINLAELRGPKHWCRSSGTCDPHAESIHVHIIYISYIYITFIYIYIIISIIIYMGAYVDDHMYVCKCNAM